MAQTQVTPITQDELSKILSGNVDSIITPEDPEKKDDKKEDKVPENFKKPVNTDFTWKELNDLSKDEDKDDKSNDTEPVVIDNESDKKPGRKASDLVTMVNELVENKDLFGFEDGPVKTIEEAKELIKLNIEQTKNATVEELWQDKVKKYSPQVQAILHYAEQGGTDVTPLISAISEVERTSNFDIETEEGQESIISEYLRVTGWADDEIKDEIETTKDIGKLKAKAEKFLPKLNQMNEQRMEQIMQEQAVRQQQAEEARRNYLATIKGTLDKDRLGDIKLVNKEKALIWEGLTDVKYTSWSGQPTNLFFKKLEEMQAGDKADYDHFLEIVYLTLNRKSFKDKLREEIKTNEAANTVKKLKIEESRKSATNEGFDEEPRKNVIKRQGFKNPWG
jgi:hypothetical protein